MMAALEAVERLQASAAPRVMARAMVRIINRILIFRLAPPSTREPIIEDDRDNDAHNRQALIYMNGSLMRRKTSIDGLASHSGTRGAGQIV